MSILTIKSHQYSEDIKGCLVCGLYRNDPNWSDGCLEQQTANNRQVDGDHYQSEIQPWDYIEANNLTFIEGSIIKYVTRHKKKNGVRDLKKAQHFLEKLIEIEQSKPLSD